jgi:EmrB/QacA subfamily drug resistance transporter
LSTTAHRPDSSVDHEITPPVEDPALPAAEVMAVSSSSARADLAPLAGRHPAFVVVGLALLMFSLDQTSVATALTTLGADLHADLAWTSWTVTACAAGQILALPLGGRLGDQFGRKRVFLVAIAVFALFSGLCATSSNIGELIVFRFVQGVAGGAMLPAANGLVAYHYGRDRDRALAMFTSIFPIGAILGPMLGGLILATWSWQGIFLINVPLALAMLAAGAFVLREPPRERPKRVDARGIALMMVTLVASMVAITMVGSLGSALSGAVLVAAAAVALVGGRLFLRHAARHTDAVIPLRLLRGRSLGLLNVVNVLFGAGAIGFAALLPLYAQTRYGILPLAAAVLVTSRAVGTLASSGFAVALLRRLGFRPLLLGGFGLVITGLVLTALPAMGVSAEVWLSIGSGLLGLGMGLAAPAANNAAMHLVPGDVTAVAGLRGMFRQVGGIATVAMITAVVSASSTPGLAGAVSFGVLAALLLCAALGVTRIPNHRGRW